MCEATADQIFRAVTAATKNSLPFHGSDHNFVSERQNEPQAVLLLRAVDFQSPADVMITPEEDLQALDGQQEVRFSGQPDKFTSVLQELARCVK